MKIEVITMWYNEEFLSRFFLNNYSFADKITVIIDKDSTDQCETIARSYPNTSIEYVHFPRMLETQIAVDRLNEASAKSTADWVMVVDCDEFISPRGIREILENDSSDIIFVRFYQPFRHVTDSDLDPSISVFAQRRHGDPYVVKGQNREGKKPCVIRPRKRIRFMPGNHKIWNRHKYITSDTILLGAHWTMADPCFCVERRTKFRRDRMSEANLKLGHNVHDHNITEEAILQECADHLYDKEMFQWD